MDRGMDGVLPRTPTLADESYLDFYEGVRNLAIREFFPHVAARAEQVADDAGLEGRGSRAPIEQLVRVADADPLVAMWKRIMRSQQHASWRRVRESLYAEAARHESELNAAERRRPGRLHYDPTFQVPDYAALDIHLQPGGYLREPLAGRLFHHGTKVFYQGENDQDELHQQVVSFVRPPADGRVARVLDVGCSIGQCTTALKQRFPQAEVHGLDVALPLVRYAHKRATDLDIDVHFHQGLAESLPFPSGHFDVVLAYILFHEVPEHLFAPIVAEITRVLRPGGTFSIVDAPNGTEFPAGNRIWMQFDARWNCEPYAPAFVASDFPRLLESQGLTLLAREQTPTFLWFTACEKPL
ncbi:MAG: class I SAM-dependent methyltransferase [Gammaproteobacteria bacterium]|nr:class I SAM-dependent methyltransferase [Gammaproteobacteria bacterium]